MRTRTLLFYLLFFGIASYGQIKTRTIIVDLEKPKLSYDTIAEKSKWLSVKASEQLVIKLINGNPLKYTYKIGTEELSFFSEEKPDASSLIDEVKKQDQGEEFRSETTSIVAIVDKNKEVSASIDRLNIEADALYQELRERIYLKAEDLNGRQDFLDNIKNKIGESYDLLNALEEYKEETNYEEVKSSLNATKEKAEKSLEDIIQKFYSFSLDVFTLPMDVQGKNIDAVEFRLTRSDKETGKDDPDFAPHPYNVWVRGGFKIDVSAGIFFTSLFDDAFDKKDDPAITENKIIVKKNLGEYDFAFGSSINIHSRWNSWLNMGGNLGIAFTTSQKFQVLTGMNVILGKQERIILTGGLAMGKVERLADSYLEGGSYNLGAEGVIPTQSQFKFGHFFGITYNLSKVKRISLEKGIE